MRGRIRGLRSSARFHCSAAPRGMARSSGETFWAVFCMTITGELRSCPKPRTDFSHGTGLLRREDERVEFLPLGRAREVGGSCSLLTLAGVRLLIDAGIR